MSWLNCLIGLRRRYFPTKTEMALARAAAMRRLKEEKIAVVVDWSQAPLSAVEWRYGEQDGIGRWLNGRHTIEEWGCVWEWEPAPSFGARHEMRVKRAPGEHAAANAAALLETATAAASATSMSRRI